ncbi:LOW QUALITY PROTEIN: hypothetical protein PHMEG_00024880 [Phytophthora megakarya]|uniref:Retrotransposon gag domain-containing protein n=1 Tax=Phytophthora megakarya TaxID=4795 RepID=A0A225VDD8_9STRA|nr:LOW QUALITY PROTEIN: hypothetical protein PHMEG_00024880 [Phytophthora megakarya]
MSWLGGRARSWAYGRRLTDPTCFSTYKSFKEELKLAFEPHRTSSGRERSFSACNRHDVHAYGQWARYLVSNVVTDPMDEATKVVTFMKGLRDGPVKTYLFREYPSTLEAAITLAMHKARKTREATCDFCGAETWFTTHVSVRHQYTQDKVDVAILGIVTKWVNT